MRIYPVTQNSSISFKRQLTKAEETELQKITTEAKQVLGNTGNSVLVVPDASLPQIASKNTGVGNLLNEESAEFFNFAKTYWGINTVQMLPQGEFVKKGRAGMVCSYSYSALGLNDSLINIEALTQPKWNKLLSKKDFDEVVSANNKFDKATMINFENVHGEDSVFQQKIQKAFARFMALDKNHPLRKEYAKFQEENADWLKPKELYRILKRQNGGRDFHQWGSELDRTLLETDSRFSPDVRLQRINEILESDRTGTELFRFKQFLAEKHLQESREKLNKQGLKLVGDVLINFSEDEKWANQSAFKKDYYIGSNDWRASCLDYHSLVDESSPASTLLKRKFALAARRYDGIRVDAGWMYINPRMINRDTKAVERLELGSTVLDMVEKEFARVKGGTYNAGDISYEFKAGWEEFSMFRGGALRPEVVKRMVILESEYLNDGWGFNDYYKNIAKFKPDGYIFGVGDHTAQPLSQIALGLPDAVESFKCKIKTPIYRRDEHAHVLAQVFGDSAENLSRPANFVRAKFADIMAAKHNFVFFMDALGRITRYDAQGLNNADSYRFKVSENYKALYHKNVQRGLGLNLPDVLSKAFEKAGLQESHADLYKKLKEYAGILKEKDVSQTFEAASNVSRGKFVYVACVLACVSGALMLGSALFNKPVNSEIS